MMTSISIHLSSVAAVVVVKDSFYLELVEEVVAAVLRFFYQVLVEEEEEAAVFDSFYHQIYLELMTLKDLKFVELMKKKWRVVLVMKEEGLEKMVE